jgi:hypothetical protein
MPATGTMAGIVSLLMQDYSLVYVVQRLKVKSVLNRMPKGVLNF